MTREQVGDRQKILIWVTTSPHIEPEIVDAILNQTSTVHWDLMFTRDNPYKSPEDRRLNIQLNYEKMRQVAIQGKYWKVWNVESDTIPPSDALEKLLGCNAQVASGYYILRQSLVPNLHREWDKRVSGYMGHLMSWEYIRDNWGQIVSMGGGCMGCVLIDTEVLARFPMEILNYRLAPDLPFMSWCHKNKINQKAHLGVVCGHKKPDGEIIWPDRIGRYRLGRAAA